MDRRYKHLNSEERGVIFAEHRRGASLRAIGSLLGRHASTISRELRRGRGGDGHYSPEASRRCHDTRRLRSRRSRRLAEGSALHIWVRGKLVHWRWSPEQIAGSSMVPETLRIIHRPEEIEARIVPGHWEGDLIKGAFNRSSVGTLVERKTRFVVLCKMNGNGAEAALEGFTRQMKRMPAMMRKSMTYDRGSEMACHPDLARRLKIDIWFCDPHAPWQRGSNENTNGLLRQFMPKGTDLSQASQTWLNDIVWLLNGRPRKTFGWKTPAEAMAAEIAAFN